MNVKKSLLTIALTLFIGCTGLKEFNEKLANINNKLSGTSQSTTNEKRVINLIDTTKSKYGEFKKLELVQDKDGYWSFSFEYINKTNTPHILELIFVFRDKEGDTFKAMVNSNPKVEYYVDGKNEASQGKKKEKNISLMISPNDGSTYVETRVKTKPL
ncbi:hypothetical protein FSDG_01463 [Fusobacterium animalis 7_1]|jgi:hypothetical protein|uniref:Lipoprotein n=1 Tax=Fusobacterium animalis 7_1 TaxID=457405 RepID=A0A140PRW9_9FUSO|nr:MULTISPECIES: hypothetical protein [Fusobacterium]EEO42904.2 hypothetical protein FSDG_01463 [Fusobacterium animalis 7_1]EPC08386.1 hypothetical protein HMPREF9369_03189 [Fusobacterium polymorphum F0401]